MLAWRQALYNASHLTKEMFVTAPEIQWIRDDASLAQQCREWRTQPYLALDTEFMRVDTFYPAAGLVQVGDGRQEWLIDPLLIQDWSPFAELLEDERVVKVLHACSEDLEVFLRLTGSLPVPLFDTQLAAAYLGMAHSMGYSKLVKEVLDIDLPKDETRSDWLQRPLTEMQMRYAADDVQHLAQVYLALDARLSEEKRAWLLEDGAELVANLCRESDPREAYREVKLGWRLRVRSNWRCSANSAPGARSRHACATGRATTCCANAPCGRWRACCRRTRPTWRRSRTCIRAPCARTATSSSN